MTTKNTNVDYYEKDWNELEQELESSLEEIFGLDLPRDEADEDGVDEILSEVTLTEETLTEAEEKAEETKEYPFTPEELEMAVKNAQAGNRVALEQLYHWFKPLIMKAAHSYSIYTVLDEDAENIAWQIFYEFVYKYDDNKYRYLPGLFRKVVRYRLLDAAKARANYDPNVALDEFTVMNAMGLENDYWDNMVSNINLLMALHHITQFQQTIIKLIYFEECSSVRTAKILHKSYEKIRYHHKTALCLLKQYYLHYRNMHK